MTDTLADTLADALPREIARVTAKKERWMAMMLDHPELTQSMCLSVIIMANAIDRGIRACASGDVVEILQSYANLITYDGED